MKLNRIEEWKLLPPRGHWRTLGWKWIDWVEGSAGYGKGDLTALLSAHVERDGNRWLHLSLGRRTMLPSYEELQDAHRAFLGDRLAYQLFMPESEHVNLHPFVLHLWAPIDHRPTPDFRNIDGLV